MLRFMLSALVLMLFGCQKTEEAAVSEQRHADAPRVIKDAAYKKDTEKPAEKLRPQEDGTNKNKNLHNMDKDGQNPDVNPDTEKDNKDVSDVLKSTAIKVVKFEYPAVKKLENKDYDTLIASLKKSASDLDLDDDATVVTLAKVVDAFEDEKINSVDGCNYPIFFFFADEIFPKIQSKTEAKRIRNIVKNFLRKGANPFLTGYEDRALFESEAMKKAPPLLSRTIKFYEPSLTVRNAILAIKVSLGGEENWALKGKNAIADLKLLEPYICSLETKNLVANIIMAFDDEKLRSDAQFVRVDSAVKNFIAGLDDKTKTINNIDELTLKDALTLLAFLSHGE